MRKWEKVLIYPSTPILEAIKIIDESGLQIALVIDEGRHLQGVITDGDIRRGLLRGVALGQPVHLIMNREFSTASSHASREEILGLMKMKDLRPIPVVDDQGRVMDLKILNDLIALRERPNWVVLMAGGLGRRLHPLTDDCPKPLLKVGDKPLLETIIENFIAFGFRKYFVSVNYKAEMIEDFLGDGARWGIDVTYLKEDMKMGTAGALSLLPSSPVHPLIVMNGDVLTKVNMQHLLDFHSFHNSKATMCVQEYHFQVPFGVVETDLHRLIRIDEKPTQRFFVNAGIYVLEPETLDHIPRNAAFDMTMLFDTLISMGYETVVFPIREYWMDIGRPDDFVQANGEYHINFTKPPTIT